MAYPSVTYTFTNGTTADGANVSTNFTNLVSGFSDGTKDFNMNAGTLAGNFTCNGNVVLGNATSDTIALTGIVSIGTSGSYLANLGGTVLLPTYTFTGDLNTGIWSSGADAIDISTAGVQRVRVDSNGVFTIGSSASPPAASIRLGQTFAIHTSAAYGGVSLNTWSTTAAEGSVIDFNRSKSATIGTMTVVASGDLVGSVNFRAADGTNFINVAGITAYVDGTPGTNDMPGRLSFLTTADGAAALTERLRIDSSGSIIINATSSIGATTSKLQINDDQATVGGISINRFINSTSGNSMAFTKSRNATVGSHTIVNSGDSIGSIPFYGSDGTNYVVAAQIQGAVDGTPGTNDMPGRLIFSTTADGASSLTERMRIDSSGRVGIGLTPSLYRLEVSGDIYNGGNKIITNRSGAAAWDSNGLHIQIDGTTYGKIGLDSSSMLRINTGLTVDGGQIKFPATQVSSSDANTLDDYEEGTWTPSVGGNATYIKQVGTYTKIGRHVYFSCLLHINAIGTGSATTVSGLPFTAAAGDATYGINVSYWTSAVGTFVYLGGEINASSTNFIFYGATAAATALSVPVNVFQNSTLVRVSGHYIV